MIVDFIITATAKNLSVTISVKLDTSRVLVEANEASERKILEVRNLRIRDLGKYPTKIFM